MISVNFISQKDPFKVERLDIESLGLSPVRLRVGLILSGMLAVHLYKNKKVNGVPQPSPRT